MKDLALSALDAVARHGVTYADARALEIREREVTTKNGKAGHVSSSESMGIGIRVLANGCWGFAATDRLTAAAPFLLAERVSQTAIAPRQLPVSSARASMKSLKRARSAATTWLTAASA